MSHYNGKPVLYVIGSDGWKAIVKYGTTRNVAYRKNPYATSNPYPVYYKIVFVLDDTVLDSRGLNLYLLDSIYFPRWLERRGLGDIKCKFGGGTEFYKHDSPTTDPTQLVREFLAYMEIPIIEEITDDSLFPLHAVGEPDTDAARAAVALATEDAERVFQKREALKECLKHRIDMTRFINAFIPGKALRSHQAELWAVWETILATCTSYKGIIQWPTGTGKTFAMLMLMLLTAQFLAERGETYRGILIAPKNDILDSIMKHVRKMSAFGIQVLEGQRGNYSSLTIPSTGSFILVVTHAALADEQAWIRLSGITHIHYDEVHRITGEEFFGQLKLKLQEWGTKYVTGTSATPKTSNKIQHQKIAELFGDPMTILHRAELDDMVARGYIARPRFHICQIPNSEAEIQVHSMLEQIQHLVIQRQEAGQWRGGKAIVYFDNLHLVNMAYCLAKTKLPLSYKLYAAMDRLPSKESDAQFVGDPADGTPRILFACEKYREGADIDGLEITQVLMGKTIAAYILVQIIGRAIRADFPGKEGWCCIMRPQFEDDGDTTALEHILFDLEAFVQNRPGALMKADFKEFVQNYFGDVQINGRTLDLDETLTRVQQMYLRRQLFPETSYKIAHELCLEHNIQDSTEYKKRQSSDLNALPENPETYYKGFGWKGWHEFLHGSERTITSDAFVNAVVKEMGIYTADSWVTAQTTYPTYPTLQQIHDGYFEGVHEFNAIVKKAQVRVGRR